MTDSEKPSQSASPLAGIRVLDLSRLLPGPFCSQILGDFGADVIKVEDTGAGNAVRLAPPYLEGNLSAVFLSVNRNKRGVRINLKTPGGREALVRLARKSDVLLEGFRPGVMDRLSLGYETLRAENERLIYCAITGYGQNGPYRDRAGHDLNYMALSGALDMTGAAGAAPTPIGVQVADLTGALYGTIGILLALQARIRTGKGQFVDASMLDGVLSLLSIHAGSAFGGSAPNRGRFPLSGAMANYAVYETRDGRYLSIGSLEPQFLTTLCATLGVDAPQSFGSSLLSGDFASDGLRGIFTAKFKEKTFAEWREVFAKVDCCVEPVLTVDEALDSDITRGRGMRRALPHPDLGLYQAMAPGVRLSESPAEFRHAPPGLGEHTDAILSEIGGYGAAEIATLKAQGAIA